MATRAFTDEEVAAIIRKHWPDLPSAELPTVIAIVRAESGGNPSAVNRGNKNGTSDYGLFQVNDVNWDKSVPEAQRLDPDVNAKKAYEVYKRQGLKAWSVYKSGKHTKFMDNATKAAGKVPMPETATVGRDILSGLGAAAGVGGGMLVTAATSPMEAISQGVNALTGTLAKFVNSSLLWLVAIVMIILGLLIVARKPVGVVASAVGPGKIVKAAGIVKAATSK